MESILWSLHLGRIGVCSSLLGKTHIPRLGQLVIIKMGTGGFEMIANVEAWGAVPLKCAGWLRPQLHLGLPSVAFLF